MEHASAAASVLRVLKNSMLPEWGQLAILYQAVPLLERQELPPLFSVKDTDDMLMHLHVCVARSLASQMFVCRDSPLF